jgi:hypothetical protein
LERFDGRIASSSLDAGDVSSIEIGTRGKLLLTELSLKTKRANGRADVARKIHAAFLGGCGPSDHGI